MKDYEKRQRDSKGRYKTSIHTNAKKNKKNFTIAEIICLLIFLYFLAQAVGNKGGN